MKDLRNSYNKLREDFSDWVKFHYFNLALFNVILIMLFLLRSAGYFSPFFPISVNFIVFSALIFAIALLKARSKAMFFVGIALWIFAAIIRIVKIEVWAERTAVYAFEAIFLGVVLLIFETVKARNKQT